MKNRILNHALKFIVLLFLFSSSCSSRKTVDKKTGPAPVSIEAIATEQVSMPVHSAGILFSEDEIKLSFKTGGILASVSAREGQRVKKGQLLASLNLSEISAQVNLATTAYEKADRDYTRARNLYSDSVATLEQFQNAGSALQASKSNLEIARFNLNHSKITAPADGVILKQLVKQGEMTGAGYPVFLFGTRGKSWKVKCGISDREVVKINPGDSATVVFDAWPGVVFTAVVNQIAEMADQLTGTYEVEMLLDDKGYRLATGFIATTDIFPREKETRMLVPVEALVDIDGETGSVFTLTDSATVRKRTITIIGLSGNKAVIIGLDQSESHIVTGGAAYLRDGEHVSVSGEVQVRKY
ncbi:MAG: efflux RND transporter periplasmic adaptor subunit [Bacteroidales bacterium]